jgi:hypothetical protein
VNKLLVKLSMTATVGGLLCASPTLAQMSPAAKNASVTITSQPTLEIAYDDICIIRWTITNPGGSDDHFGVVNYGTSPDSLDQKAKSHIRLNRGHAEAMFRVRMAGLKPGTTYYFKVTSTEANDTSDGAESDVGQFTTPAPGQRIERFPQPR